MPSRVLVIDDDDIARELVLSILRDAGYEAFEAASPIGATQLVLREHIDIVVVDVLIPELRGDKLASLLRSNHRLEGLIIILISSCGQEELHELAKAVGADGTVNKKDVRTHLLPAIERAGRTSRVTERRDSPYTDAVAALAKRRLR